MSKEKSNKARTRNYACVVYPESAPLCWHDMLEDLKIPCFVSPLHDQDLNPTGEPKKPHYHVLVMFDNVKTEKQAKDLFESFGGVGCEVVNSTRAYARYLCHLDNPEKAQYSVDYVTQFGGADYRTVIGTMSDKAKSIREMIDFINNNHILYFADLLEYCSINKSDWFDCLINSGAYVIKEYIKSYAFRQIKQDSEEYEQKLAEIEELKEKILSVAKANGLLDKLNFQ